MIPTIAEIKRNLQAAASFMRFNNSGLGLFEVSDASFWKSFFAAVIYLPGYYYLSQFHESENVSTIEPFAALLIQSLLYVLHWITYPVLMHALLVLHNKEQNFRIFVIGYNWLQVWQIALLVVLQTLAASGIFPETLPELLGIGSIFYILGTQAYLTKNTIETSWLPACTFVFAQILLSMSLNQLNIRLLAP